MDSTVALVADSMYKAYPDAKFILVSTETDEMNILRIQYFPTRQSVTWTHGKRA